YPIPPRSAILGMIGAILGIERETGVGKYPEGQTPLADLLAPKVAKIAVQLLSPVTKVRMAFNLINTKSKSSFFNIENRTQIEYELLKRPAYRIFLNWKDKDLATRFETYLQNNQSHFTVCLGLSQFVASISYVGKSTMRHNKSSQSIPVISAVRLDVLDQQNPIQFNKNFKYLSETYPNVLTSDRLVTEFAEIIVEASANPITINSGYVYSVDGFGNIVFL